MSRLQVEYGLNWRWTAKKVRRHIDDSESSVLVATIDGVLAGFAIMKFGEYDAHLMLLAVTPKLRRTGIGTAFVLRLESSCRTANVGTVRLEVRATNDSALRFYSKLGYACTAQIAAYYEAKEAAIVMTRVLDGMTS